MSPRAQPSGPLRRAIREILLKDWDPIGVSDIPEAQDEYDSYVGGVEGLLLRGAAPDEIAAHLARIEGEQMGLPASADGNLPAARKLRAIVADIGDRAV